MKSTQSVTVKKKYKHTHTHTNIKSQRTRSMRSKIMSLSMCIGILQNSQGESAVSKFRIFFFTLRVGTVETEQSDTR